MGHGATQANGLEEFIPINISKGGVHLGEVLLEILSFERVCHGSCRQKAQKVPHFVDTLIVKAVSGK